MKCVIYKYLFLKLEKNECLRLKFCFFLCLNDHILIATIIKINIIYVLNFLYIIYYCFKVYIKLVINITYTSTQAVNLKWEIGKSKL